MRKHSSCVSNHSDLLKSYLKPGVDKPVNELELTLVRSWPPTKQFQDSLEEEHEIYAKYQVGLVQA